MAASTSGLMALLCFAAALVCLALSVRKCDFLDVLDSDTFTPSPAPNVAWLGVAFVCLLGFVIFAVAGLSKASGS